MLYAQCAVIAEVHSKAAYGSRLRDVYVGTECIQWAISIGITNLVLGCEKQDVIAVVVANDQLVVVTLERAAGEIGVVGCISDGNAVELGIHQVVVGVHLRYYIA